MNEIQRLVWKHNNPGKLAEIAARFKRSDTLVSFIFHGKRFNADNELHRRISAAIDEAILSSLPGGDYPKESATGT